MTDARPFFQVSRLESALGLRLSGELDLSTADELRAVLTGLPADGDAVVLDLADLTFMDSTGLHLFEQYARSRNGGRSLVLENVPANIRRLFEITGMDQSPHIELRADGRHG